MFLLFNEQSPKSQSLIDFIGKKIKETIFQSSYYSNWTIYVMTCYITEEGLNIFIKKLKEYLNEEGVINKIVILSDKQEWAKLFFFRKKYLLKKIRENANNMNLDIVILPVGESEKLFHAKSYALINNNSLEGFVISTSANLTQRGLTDNLELGLLVKDEKSIKNYLNLFSRIQEELVLTDKVKKELEILATAYSILSGGEFYYKTEVVETKHYVDLNKRGQELKKGRSTLASKKAVGNVINPKAESFRLIDFQEIKELLPSLVPDKFIDTYSINTQMGRWIPKEYHQSIVLRKEKYGQAYISFMRENYLNDDYLTKEKGILRDLVITELQDYREHDNQETGEDLLDYKSHSKDDYINNFINKCYQNIKDANLIDDDESVVKIFFNYLKIEEDLNRRSNKFIMDTYTQIINHISRLKKVSGVNKIIQDKKCYLEDLVNDENFIDNKFLNSNINKNGNNNFEQKEKLDMYEQIEKLTLDSTFSMLIAEKGDLKIITNCTFIKKEYKHSYSKKIYYSREGSNYSIDISNIKLFKAIQDRSNKSKTSSPSSNFLSNSSDFI